MAPRKHFSAAALAHLDSDQLLGLRAGTSTNHRVIAVWMVVVDGRLFVRSYTLKPRSWWRTFLEDPFGEIFLAQRKRGIQVRARQVKSQQLIEKVSAAYREKYHTPGSVGYVTAMARSPSKDTTTELVPV